MEPWESFSRSWRDLDSRLLVLRALPLLPILSEAYFIQSCIEEDVNNLSLFETVLKFVRSYVMVIFSKFLVIIHFSLFVENSML